jgi:hypothetical protein
MLADIIHEIQYHRFWRRSKVFKNEVGFETCGEKGLLDWSLD